VGRTSTASAKRSARSGSAVIRGRRPIACPKLASPDHPLARRAPKCRW
jgi:hypothetical protein